MSNQSVTLILRLHERGWQVIYKVETPMQGITHTANITRVILRGTAEVDRYAFMMSVEFNHLTMARIRVSKPSGRSELVRKGIAHSLVQTGEGTMVHVHDG
jgi:hypothetical protein